MGRSTRSKGSCSRTDSSKFSWHVNLELVKSDVLSQTSSRWCGVESLMRYLSAQVTSSSSDHGSKLRGLFQRVLALLQSRTSI
ncbi:hypothetical protein AVEN_261097-1 [Araneus ventricosus]|uniref:Uncharacterized protein n=1 Tax=Araneus ventricosus TaxID=182803 RepID=A0A4Y2UKH9_ARAVE|nr:hypothetical protein AVEN_180308-1 [Araneus ventricosus]GBO12156.1 hypothetical protein AVEN_261097-1 [Araneus ventricosus]